MLTIVCVGSFLFSDYGLIFFLYSCVTNFECYVKRDSRECSFTLRTTLFLKCKDNFLCIWDVFLHSKGRAAASWSQGIPTGVYRRERWEVAQKEKVGMQKIC